MTIWQYTIRRLVLLIPFLLMLSLLTFFLSRVIPADPAALAAGPYATKEMREALRKEFQLDRPLSEQYLSYMLNLIQGDMGRSIMSRRPVLDDIRRYYPATLELAISSILIALAIGVPAGVVSARFRDRAGDHLARLFSLAGLSFPNFWLGLMAQLLLAYTIRLFPIGGRFAIGSMAPPTATGLYVIDSILSGDVSSLLISLRYLAMPAFVGSVGALATIARMTRSSMLDTESQDFVLTARASGIPESVILIRYRLRVAMRPVLTMIGLWFTWMLGGSVVIETIFDWPGLGYYAAEAVLLLDYQPIMGVTLVFGLSCGLVSLAVDILYGLLDPRVRYG